MKVLVIKLGGEISVENIVEDISRLFREYKIVIVHGGGRQVSEYMIMRGKKPRFVNGLRYTDEETIEIIKQVFPKIREEIVSKLTLAKIPSIGISGTSGIFELEPLNIERYGYVARIKRVNKDVLEFLLEKFVVVISPIGIYNDGMFYNINADEVANKVAIHLKAETLIYLTKKPGVLLNPNDESSIIEEISYDMIDSLIKSGSISGGMIPKILSCKEAIERGVKNVVIMSGIVKNPITKFLKGNIKCTRIYKG